MSVDSFGTLKSPLAILDSERLSRRSMGSEALRVEILALFVAEVERLLRQVEQAGDEKIRADRLEAVRELARTVGAARLDEAARTAAIRLEAGEADLTTLRQAVQEVVEAIRRGDP